MTNLKSRLRAAEGVEETYSSAWIICPYCEHKHVPDPEDFREGDKDFTCDECGKEFNLRVSFDVTFEGMPIE